MLEQMQLSRQRTKLSYHALAISWLMPFHSSGEQYYAEKQQHRLAPTFSYHCCTKAHKDIAKKVVCLSKWNASTLCSLLTAS